MDLTLEVKPYLIRRSNGEWLAIAPKNALFSVGVTAETAEEAEDKFRSVYKQWISLFEGKDLTYPKEQDMTVP